MLLAYLQVMALWAVRIVAGGGPEGEAGRDRGGSVQPDADARLTSRLGGFEATPMEILEDLTLGRRVKTGGDAAAGGDGAGNGLRPLGGGSARAF